MKTIVCIGNERLAVPYGAEDTVKSVCKVALKRYLALCKDSIPQPPDCHMRTMDNALLDDDDLLASVINPNDEVKIVFGHKAQTMADSTFIPTQWAFDRANYQNGSPNSSKGSGGKSHMFKKNPNLLSSSTTNLTASKFSTAPKLKSKKLKENEVKKDEEENSSNFSRSSARKSLGSTLANASWFEAKEKIEENNNTSFNGYPVSEDELYVSKIVTSFTHGDAQTRLFYDSDENKADNGNKEFEKGIDEKFIENISSKNYDKNNAKINETNNIIASSNTRRIGQKIELELTKGAKGFGFAITSRDNMGELENPVCVKNIATGGVAMLDGRMQLMDRLLTVNGVDVKNSKQAEVTQLLRQIPVGGTLKLTISRQSNKASEKNRELYDQNEQKNIEEGSSIDSKPSKTCTVEASTPPLLKRPISSYVAQLNSSTSKKPLSEKQEYQPLKKSFSTTSINSLASSGNKSQSKTDETSIITPINTVPFINVFLTNVFKSKPQFNPIIKDSRFVGFIVKVNNKSMHVVEIDGVRLDTLSGLSEGENLIKKSIQKNQIDSVVIKLIDPSMYHLYAGSNIFKIKNSQTLPKSSRSNRVAPKITSQSSQQSSQSIDNHRKRPLSSAVKRLSAIFFDSHFAKDTSSFPNNESIQNNSVDNGENTESKTENNIKDSNDASRLTQNQLGNFSNKPTTNKQAIKTNDNVEKNEFQNFSTNFSTPVVTHNNRPEKSLGINNNLQDSYDSDDGADFDYFNREAVGRRSVSEKRKGKLNPKNLDIFKNFNKISTQNSCDNSSENNSDIDYATWHGRKLKRSKEVKHNNEIAQIAKQFKSMDDICSAFDMVEPGTNFNENNSFDNTADKIKPTDSNGETGKLNENANEDGDENHMDNTQEDINDQFVVNDAVPNGNVIDEKLGNVVKVNDQKSLLSRVMRSKDNFSRYKLSLSAKKTNKTKIEKSNISTSKSISKNNVEKKWSHFLKFGSLPIKLKSVKKLSESKDNLAFTTKPEETKKDDFSSPKLPFKVTSSQTPKIGAATKIYTKSSDKSNSNMKNVDLKRTKSPTNHVKLEHKVIETTAFPYSPPPEGANRISFTKALSYRSPNTTVTSRDYNAQQIVTQHGRNLNKKLSLDQLKIKNIIRSSTKSDSYCINKSKSTDLNNNIQKNECPGSYENNINHINNFDTELDSDLYFVNENMKININTSSHKRLSKNIAENNMSPITSLSHHPTTNLSPPPTTMFRLYGQRLRPEGKEDLSPFLTNVADESRSGGVVVNLETYKKCVQKIPNLKVMEHSNLYKDQKESIQEAEESFLGAQNRLIKNGFCEESDEDRKEDRYNEYPDQSKDIHYLHNTWSFGKNYMIKNIERNGYDYKRSIINDNNKSESPQKHTNNTKSRVVFSYSQDPTNNKECQNRRMLSTPKDVRCEHEDGYEYTQQGNSFASSTFYVPLRRHSSDNQHEGNMQPPQQIPYKLSRDHRKLSTSQHKLPIDESNNYVLPRMYFQKKFFPNKSYQLAQENPLCLISPYHDVEDNFDDIDFQHTENINKNPRAYQSDKPLLYPTPLSTNITDDELQGYDFNGNLEPYGLYYKKNINKALQTGYDDRKENRKNYGSAHRGIDTIEHNRNNYNRTKHYYELMTGDNIPKHVTKLNVNYDEIKTGNYNKYHQNVNNMYNTNKNKAIRLINSTVRDNFKTELRVGGFQRSLL